MGFFHTIFLFDGFRSVRASLFGNTLRGGAPAGAGMRIPTPVCGLARNDRLFRQPASRLRVDISLTEGGRGTRLRAQGADSHASDIGHWLGMTPLRGVRGGQRRPPLRTVTRGAVVKRRGDAPQGYLFRFAPLRGHRPLRSNARGAVQNRNLGIAFWRGTWYNGGKEYRERSFLYVGYF